MTRRYFEKYFKKAFVPTQYAHDTVEATRVALSEDLVCEASATVLLTVFLSSV